MSYVDGPYTLRDRAKAKLDRLVAKGILRWLNEGKITEGLSGPSFVIKPGRGMRLETDLVNLNRALQCPTHPFSPINDILSLIDAEAKYFVTLDCLGGYWQITLDPKSQKLVAFLMEWGRMTYLRAPMGLMFLGDIFCHRAYEALAGHPGVQKLVDDVLVKG